MPILGMYVPDALQAATRQALIDWFKDSRKTCILRLYTKADRFELRRKAYTGDFHIWGKNTNGFFPIAEFAILPMPGCRGICVFHHVKVEPEFRRVGLGATFLKLRMEVAKTVGYSLAICTVQNDNGIEKEMLRKAEWSCLQHFTNARTEHIVDIWSKRLS